MPNYVALNPTSPVHPNFLVCDREYGSGIIYHDCNFAGGIQLPRGQSPVYHYLNNAAAANTLPFNVALGSCAISVEYAGPDYAAPSYVQLIPNDIRGMAGWVIHQCAFLRNGIGGFVTGNLAHLLDYVRISGSWTYTSAVINVGFITVSITGPDARYRKPGDTDPAIPYTIAGQADTRAGELWDEGNEDTPLYEHFADIVDRLDRREEQMQRGGSLTWWEDSPLPPDQMVYECDANLGSPALVDCNQLQWQGLGPTSDTVTINPETPKFFSSMPSEDTCNIAISATTTTTLMWRQLQTALNTLMNVCVENPIKSSQGGRAHFALNPPPSKYHRKRGKRDSQVTGLDALPPSVNVTIFAHDASSTLNCEWQAAQKDVALSSCAQV